MVSEPHVLWFVLGVALSIMEIFTAGFFIIWFGIAAFITAVVAYFFHNVVLELAMFTFSSMVLLVLTKPFYAKINNGPKVASNVDALKGKTGLVVADINNTEGQGLVKVNGETWSARAIDGEKIAANSKVRIEQVEGAKLMVRNIE